MTDQKLVARAEEATFYSAMFRFPLPPGGFPGQSRHVPRGPDGLHRGSDGLGHTVGSVREAVSSPPELAVHPCPERWARGALAGKTMTEAAGTGWRLRRQHAPTSWQKWLPGSCKRDCCHRCLQKPRWEMKGSRLRGRSFPGRSHHPRAPG